MKNTGISIFVLAISALLFSGCPPEERIIESTLYYTTEENNSSYDLFIQYYLENGQITRKKIYSNSENRTHFYNYDYDKYGDAFNVFTRVMYSNNYLKEPDADPQLTYYESDLNPNERIEKILFIDINTNKIVKRLENTDDLYFLEYAEDDYGMLARFEYWYFEITDEWLKK